MSKKRGLSLEDKKRKLLEIFYESQDFFLLKELEKLGPKRGVISQSVKDVIQNLVDEDLIFKDKIGTSVYFWSLPSRAGNQLRLSSEKLKSEIECSKKRKIELQKQLDESKKERQNSDDREAGLKKLKEMEAKNIALKAELERYAENDPEVFEEKKKAIDVLKESINRWTDNIFSLQKWCNNNFPEAKENLESIYKEVGITDDLDYID